MPILTVDFERCHTTNTQIYFRSMKFLMQQASPYTAATHQTLTCCDGCVATHRDTTPDGPTLLNRSTNRMTGVTRNVQCCTVFQQSQVSTKQHVSALLLNKDCKTSSFFPLSSFKQQRRGCSAGCHIVPSRWLTRNAPPTPRLL